jgi:hypothetical protein
MRPPIGLWWTICGTIDVRRTIVARRRVGRRGVAVRRGTLCRRPAPGAIGGRSRTVPPLVLGEALSLLVARHLEAIARILVLSTGTPVARAPIAGWQPLVRGRRPPLGGDVGVLLFLRFPQTPACEPFHHRVRVACDELLQCRQQIFLRGGAEGGGLAFENDRPVAVPRRHMQRLWQL